MAAQVISFVGLGNMGGPMAANLVKAGQRVVGFDVSRPSGGAAEADGVEIAVSAKAAVADAAVAITMLPADRHVLSVWADILTEAKPGALLIDCSTIDVESA